MRRSCVEEGQCREKDLCQIKLPSMRFSILHSALLGCAFLFFPGEGAVRSVLLALLSLFGDIIDRVWVELGKCQGMHL